MALKALMLKKKLDDKRKALNELLQRDAEFETRSAELETAIAEAETDEEKTSVEEMVDEYESEKATHDQAKTDLDEEIRGLEAALDELEQNQPEPQPEAEKTERKEDKTMNKRFMQMSSQERDAFFARDDVKAYLTEVRSCIREKRALTNVGLLIPEVMLGLLRENVLEYSKLYKHVNVRQIGGDGRLVVMGNVPEAIWTECCATLNELALTFNDVEVDCYKVGGYFAVCNAAIEDSDIDLTSELMTALGQAIGLALDKAILYGTGTKMPLGVVTRLVQTAEPSGYPATARPWVDLHTSNVVALGSGLSGAALISAIVTAFGSAKGKYSRGEKVFVMNETTYTALAAATVSVNAAGQIVSGVLDRMPVIGGALEVLDFIPDNVIIGGFFDLYLLAERAGQKFATSEHVRFIQDQTVLKGTARYDGKPAIAEAFVAMALGTTKPTAAMTFAPDTANPGE